MASMGPDLNTIENLWNDMKRRVYNRLPQTMEQFEQLIREEWHASDITFISQICVAVFQIDCIC